ncbi:hypothetical protein FE257_003193 [Aspergillus nanangensis]|uniref:NACHT-NTPase and P-loop NTPases N-terminal domain-containing protein n=1 Tax=Aspergillus nanangensis TaxID=2582783 RepID=A0AAD4CBS4_ASPNN|nr:hypothetical protein FE257_003193 [Aspergillus nanangensis]
MSGIEIFGLIAGIIQVADAIVTTYKDIQNIHDLPEAFKEVSERMPIITTILRIAEAHNQAQTSENEDELKSLEDLLKQCKTKTDHLNEIFLEMKKFQRDRVRDVYKRTILRWGKTHRVETLAGSIMKDVQLIASYQIFQSATPGQIGSLTRAEEDLARVAEENPSLADSEIPTTPTSVSHSGRGDIFANSGSGVQTNIMGDSNHYAPQGDINFSVSRSSIEDLPRLNKEHEVVRKGLLEDITKKIQALPRDSNTPGVLVLAGIGGQGKSRIARQYCEDKAGRKYEDIWWVDASSEQTTIQTFEKMAAKLSSRRLGGISALDEPWKYVTYNKVAEELATQEKKILMIFDNYDEPELFTNIKNYFPNHKKTTIIITSRRQNLLRERNWGRLDIPPMTEDEALQLLSKGSGRDFRALSESHIYKEIVKMLGYLPLAIDQTRLYFSQTGSQISLYPGVLKTAMDRITEPGKETLYDTFERNLQLLPDNSYGRAARAILHLSALLGHGGIYESFFHTNVQTTSDVQSVCSDSKGWKSIEFSEVILTLTERSLIQPLQRLDLPNSSRFSLHPVIREWLIWRLSNTAEGRRASLSHRKIDAVRMLAACIKSIENQPPVLQFSQDILTHVDHFLADGDIKARLISMSEKDMADGMSETCFLFAAFYRKCGRMKSSQQLLDEMQESCQRASISPDHSMHLDISLEHGRVLLDIDQCEEASIYFNSVLECEDTLDKTRHCRALLGLAESHLGTEEPRKARTLLDSADLVVGEIPDGGNQLKVEAMALRGYAQASLGHLSDAENRLKDAYELAKPYFEENSDQAVRIALCLADLSARMRGQFLPAKNQIDCILTRCKDQYGPTHYLTLFSYFMLGRLCGGSGDAPGTRDCFEVIQSHCHTVFGNVPIIFKMELLIGHTYRWERNFIEAERHYQEAKRLSIKIGSPTARTNVSGILFMFHMGRGRILEAIPSIFFFLRTFPFVTMLRVNKPRLVPAAALLILVVFSAVQNSLLTGLTGAGFILALLYFV